MECKGFNRLIIINVVVRVNNPDKMVMACNRCRSFFGLFSVGHITGLLDA